MADDLRNRVVVINRKTRADHLASTASPTPGATGRVFLNYPDGFDLDAFGDWRQPPTAAAKAAEPTRRARAAIQPWRSFMAQDRRCVPRGVRCK
ncbi:MAG: hypothetical protein IPM99_17635 [Rubrivivax sp.]|nr:hypothetical protein [Rubrivivax sp.]